MSLHSFCCAMNVLTPLLTSGSTKDNLTLFGGVWEVNGDFRDCNQLCNNNNGYLERLTHADPKHLQIN